MTLERQLEFLTVAVLLIVPPRKTHRQLPDDRAAKAFLFHSRPLLWRRRRPFAGNINKQVKAGQVPQQNGPALNK